MRLLSSFLHSLQLAFDLATKMLTPLILTVMTTQVWEARSQMLNIPFTPGQQVVPVSQVAVDQVK